MACVALISLIRTLELEFLEPQTGMVLDYRKQIQCLHERLSLLQGLLEEFEKTICVRESMKDVCAGVKDITSKAEEDIESQVMEILSMENQPASHERLHQILQSLAEDTEGVIECIKERNIEESNALQSIGSSNHENIIGHAKELARMKEMLLQRSPQERQVMSIVGMGGIGKTTLAKIIYEDFSRESHFDLLGWATVSQDHNLRKIVYDLYCSAVKMIDDEINKVDTDDLKDELRKCLLGQRYLLVVDDIWGTREWDELQSCFPENSNGSRILLTTRLKEVADYTSGSGEYICNLPFLNSNESWKLFSHHINVSNKESLPLELEKIGKRIVDKCKGLPLAIAVVAGLLSKTNKSIENWQSIASEIDLPMTTALHEQCSNILTLSYNNLPYHLQACFLYFGVFPEDYDIPTKDLTNLWIAEGFIKIDSERSLEEVAKAYLQDLIDRNLVLISKRSFSGDVKACRIHDLLHDMCLRKGKDEKLVYVIKGIEHASLSRSVMTAFETLMKKIVSVIHQWIGRVQLKETQPSCYENANRWIRFHASYTMSIFNEEYTFHKSRTLLFFKSWDSKPFMSKITWRLNNYFKMIRVLDLRALLFTNVSSIFITDLIHLRYLALYTIMDLGVAKHHWNLQTLIVEAKIVFIEEDIDVGIEWLHGFWKSQNLRYIKYPYPFPIDIDEDLVQENLHTLYWLTYLQCTKQFVLRIPNVRVLGIRWDDVSTFQSKTWWDNLHYLTRLENLTVYDYYSLTSPLPNIDSFPQKLKKLKIVGTRLQWEAITIISMLSHLEILQLSEAEYMGEEWQTSEGGFRSLKFLFISSAELKCWNTTSGHFPVLERLALHYCYNLEEIPVGFVEVLALELIELKACTPSLVESARKIHEEQQNLYGYDELIVRDYDTQAGQSDELKRLNKKKKMKKLKGIEHLGICL